MIPRTNYRSRDKRQLAFQLYGGGNFRRASLSRYRDVINELRRGAAQFPSIPFHRLAESYAFCREPRPLNPSEREAMYMRLPEFLRPTRLEAQEHLRCIARHILASSIEGRHLDDRIRVATRPPCSLADFDHVTETSPTPFTCVEFTIREAQRILA